MGIAGVAWNIKIMSFLVLGPGSGLTVIAIKALDYAKKMGAAITSNSWGAADTVGLLRRPSPTRVCCSLPLLGTRAPTMM